MCEAVGEMSGGSVTSERSGVDENELLLGLVADRGPLDDVIEEDVDMLSSTSGSQIPVTQPLVSQGPGSQVLQPPVGVAGSGNPHQPPAGGSQDGGLVLPNLPLSDVSSVSPEPPVHSNMSEELKSYMRTIGHKPVNEWNTDELEAYFKARGDTYTVKWVKTMKLTGENFAKNVYKCFQLMIPGQDDVSAAIIAWRDLRYFDGAPLPALLWAVHCSRGFDQDVDSLLDLDASNDVEHKDDLKYITEANLLELTPVVDELKMFRSRDWYNVDAVITKVTNILRADEEQLGTLRSRMHKVSSDYDADMTMPWNVCIHQLLRYILHSYAEWPRRRCVGWFRSLYPEVQKKIDDLDRSFLTGDDVEECVRAAVLELKMEGDMTSHSRRQNHTDNLAALRKAMQSHELIPDAKVVSEWLYKDHAKDLQRENRRSNIDTKSIEFNKHIRNVQLLFQLDASFVRPVSVSVHTMAPITVSSSSSLPNQNEFEDRSRQSTRDKSFDEVLNILYQTGVSEKVLVALHEQGVISGSLCRTYPGVIQLILCHVELDFALDIESIVQVCAGQLDLSDVIIRRQEKWDYKRIKRQLKEAVDQARGARRPPGQGGSRGASAGDASVGSVQSRGQPQQGSSVTPQQQQQQQPEKGGSTDAPDDDASARSGGSRKSNRLQRNTPQFGVNALEQLKRREKHLSGSSGGSSGSSDAKPRKATINNRGKRKGGTKGTGKTDDTGNPALDAIPEQEEAQPVHETELKVADVIKWFETKPRCLDAALHGVQGTVTYARFAELCKKRHLEAADAKREWDELEYLQQFRGPEAETVDEQLLQQLLRSAKGAGRVTTHEQEVAFVISVIKYYHTTDALIRANAKSTADKIARQCGPDNGALAPSYVRVDQSSNSGPSSSGVAAAPAANASSSSKSNNETQPGWVGLEVGYVSTSCFCVCYAESPSDVSMRDRVCV
jgi:hypothetical protein